MEFLTTIDGRAFDRATLTRQPCLVGFFSMGCTPCHEQAPEFAALTRSDQPTFVFVAGPDKELGDLAGLLVGVDAVVVELPMHGLGSQLGVAGYPTYISVDETGMVTRAAMSLHQLTTAVRG